MLTNEQAKELWANVQDNRNKLESCPKHRFPNTPPPYQLGAMLTCVHCGGQLTFTHIHRYLQGFMAAGGDPNEVFPGFYPEKETDNGHTESTPRRDG